MATQDDDGGQRARDQTAPVAIKRWKVAELLGNAREAEIAHGEDIYRLRLTANNKLILTK